MRNTPDWGKIALTVALAPLSCFAYTQHVCNRHLFQAFPPSSPVSGAVPLEREAREKISQELIRSFVLKSTHRNDRNIEKYLDDEFQASIQDGTWFFLFDSFDELPDVLSSTEADDKIREYRQAIDDFLHGMGRCRGVVASRPYRGPTGFGWPRFRVLPLTESRQLELIKKANRDSQLQYEVIGQLGNANEGIRSMASNPFYLTLLYKHIEGGKPFPENAYSVFATYVEQKFSEDEKRLKHLFQLDTALIRTAAEHIAFCMTASPGLGLNPTRTKLKNAMQNLGMHVWDNFELLLDALENMRLARPDVTTNAAQSRSFTFAHRRFQEYFATRAVLQETSRVSPHQLLTDAQWRETAVVLCQTGMQGILTPIVEEAGRLLVQYINAIPDNFLVPISLSDQMDAAVEDLLSKGQDTTDALNRESKSFPWPSGLLHLLHLLQDGFTNRLEELPDTIRQYIGKLVMSASDRGILPDKKWALEVSSTAPDHMLVSLLRDTYSKSKSQWLKEIAYQQVARLHSIPPEVAQGIRNALVELAATKRLRQQRYATQTYLARIHQPADFLATMQLLLRLPTIDLGLHVLLLVIFFGKLAGNSVWNQQSQLPIVVIATLLGTGLYMSHYVLIMLMGPLHSTTKNALVVTGTTMRIVLIYVLIIMLILLTFSGPSFNSISGLLIFLLIAGAYVALFGPLAFRAAQTGNFVKPGWWILLPIWPLLYPIIHPRFLFERILRGLLTILFLLLGGIILGVIITIFSILGEMPNPIGNAVHVVVINFIPLVLQWALGIWIGLIIAYLILYIPYLPHISE